MHFREQRIEQLAQEKERLQYERQRRPVSLPPRSPGPSDSYVSRPATEGGDEATDCFRLPSTAAAGGGETKGRATRHRRRPRGGGVGVAADGSAWLHDRHDPAGRALAPPEWWPGAARTRHSAVSLLRAFSRAVVHGGEQLPAELSLESAVADLRVLDAIRASAQSLQWVDVQHPAGTGARNEGKDTGKDASKTTASTDQAKGKKKGKRR